jgi:Zn-finger nucleic acid-binding protein
VDAPVDSAVDDSGPGKLCPACGAFLILHKVGCGLAFHLDRCGRCGGTWLDANEWEFLRSRDLHRSLHLVFSESWQRRVRREERTRQYRRVVTSVLDERLRRQCGEPDIERLKRFKQWIDGHPRRRELYAYLEGTRQGESATSETQRSPRPRFGVAPNAPRQ